MKHSRPLALAATKDVARARRRVERQCRLREILRCRTLSAGAPLATLNPIEERIRSALDCFEARSYQNSAESEETLQI
jgi:hypothetical protein